MVEVVITLKW